MEKGKIFVGGLSWDTDKDALQNYFASYGEVTDCVVMKNPATQKSRGFGFVSFRDPAVVDVILAQKHTIDNRPVDCKACTLRGANRPQGGGGGGGRGGSGFTGRTTKIFIGGLPNDATDDAITNFFSRFGKVTDVVIMYDQDKQRPRGFGFLTFDSEDAVELAVKEHFVDFGGKKVECKRAEPRQGGGGGNRGGRMGGGGGYGGDQNWGGMGDGSNWNQYGYGGQQGGYGGGNYGYQPSYDQSWGQQGGGYGQNWNQGYGGQGGYGQQQSWGGQQQNGQGGYGGYSGHGFSNQNNSDGQGQGYGGYSGQGFSNYVGGSGGQGYGGGSQDGYGNQSGGGYQPSQSRTGASGGGSTGYHPYKR